MVAGAWQFQGAVIGSGLVQTGVVSGLERRAHRGSNQDVAGRPLREPSRPATGRGFTQRSDRQGSPPGHRWPRRPNPTARRPTLDAGARQRWRGPPRPLSPHARRAGDQHSACRVRGGTNRDDTHPYLPCLSLAHRRARRVGFRFLRTPSLRTSVLLRRTCPDGHPPARHPYET